MRASTPLEWCGADWPLHLHGSSGCRNRDAQEPFTGDPRETVMIRNLLFVAVCLTSTAALAGPPRQFLDDAIKGDNSEMTLGRLIASRGSSAQVKSFGNTLYRDHSLAKGQAVAVARQMGVRPPTEMMPEARVEQRKLERL